MALSLKRKLAVAIVAFAAVALAGGAYAATQHSGPTPRQAFLNDVAKRLNVTPQRLRSAVQGAFLDRLAADVAAGRLTRAQASAIRKRMLQGGFLPPGLGLGGFVPAYRFGGRFGPGGLRPHGFGMFGGVGAELGAAATYLGITTSKLLSEMRSGKTLAQIASAEGKTTGGLEGALTATIKARLDKAVASKVITSAQEQKLLSHLPLMLSAVVSRSVHPWGRVGPGVRGTSRFFHRPPLGSWYRGGAGGGRAHGGSLTPLYGGGPSPAGMSGAMPPAGA